MKPAELRESRISHKIFTTQLILIVTLALFLGVAGTLINLKFDTLRRDRNLRNIAQSIASMPLFGNTDGTASVQYLDALKTSLEDIDVISVVGADNVRLYHTSPALIGTVYDGDLPKFTDAARYYTVDAAGPSGTQRRAYAAIYNADGEYVGFVMAIMLMTHIRAETLHILLIFAVITLSAIVTELVLSARLSAFIKRRLLGYEPSVFTAMYRIRDNILESLREGILAIDRDGVVQFCNQPAAQMLCGEAGRSEDIVGKPLKSACDDTFLMSTFERGVKEFNIADSRLNNADILVDRIPIMESGNIIGAAAILHNRAEYTALMEDLAGTRYLVDSMRANNHDFTNKLHVILGLIQMQMYDEATSYIERITFVQRAAISGIMNAIDEPSLAALLIGKTSRAAELNVNFVLCDDSRFSKSDIFLPTEALVSIIGNLIDNALDAMNVAGARYDGDKVLKFGIFSCPNALRITVSDTGVGISAANMSRIFDNGFSTKGEGRGTGLYTVRSTVEGLGGNISVDSQEGKGARFTVQFGNWE